MTKKKGRGRPKGKSGYVPMLVQLEPKSVKWMQKRVENYKMSWFVRTAVMEKIAREEFSPEFQEKLLTMSRRGI